MSGFADDDGGAASGGGGGVAALRSDGSGVSALHYAAYFGKTACVTSLLDLSCHGIRSAAAAEVSALLSKRQRFLDDCRYAYRQASDVSHHDDPSLLSGGGVSAGTLSAAAQVLSDAAAYAGWIAGELLRVVRSRELRCEDRWSTCLRASDRHGRTALMYAAAGKGDVETMTALLTTGRANLGAVVNDRFDVDSYVNGTAHAHGDGSSRKAKEQKKERDKSGSKQKRDVKKSDEQHYHHVQHPHCFVPPPCNTSKCDALVLLSADSALAKDLHVTPLFPRDSQFHIKTGHLKASQQQQQSSSRPAGGMPSSHGASYLAAASSGAFDPSAAGADPVAWVAGRLVAAAEERAAEQGGRRSVSSMLAALFEEFDSLGVGSLEVKNVEKVLAKAGIEVTEGIAADVCARFKDARNRSLTCKYSMLVDWAMENAKPIYKKGAKPSSPKKSASSRGKKNESKDGDHEDDDDDDREESKDDGESKANDADDDGNDRRRHSRRKNKKNSEEEKKVEAIESDVYSTMMGDSGISPTSFTDVGALRESRCKLIDTADSAGRTALHIAAAAGEVAIVKVLVKFGASRELRANDGESALSYAGTKVVRSTLLNGLLSELEGASGDLSESQKAKLANWIMMLGEGGLNVNDPLGGLALHTPLHIAAIAALPSVTDVLIARRASPTETDENGWTALHHCAARGGGDRRDIATKLISAGADVNARSSYFRTPLHLAAIGSASCTDFQPPSKRGNSSSPLKAAHSSLEDDTRMIDLLVTNGANLDAVDEGGCTPLHRAAEEGRVLSIHALIKAGCDLYASTPKKWNAMHYAAFNGHGAASLLLSQLDAERGRLVGQRDSQRCTPSEVAKDDKTRHNLKNIFMAARDADVDTLVKCLHHSDPGGMAGRKPWLHMSLEDQTWPSGLRVLHCAVLGHALRVSKASSSGEGTSSPRSGGGGGVRPSPGRDSLSPASSRAWKASADLTVQIVSLLLDKHAFVDSLDFRCRTPLHLAAAGGCLPLVDLLLNRGADVDAKDCMETNALSYAYAFKHMKVVEALILRGADEEARSLVTMPRWDRDGSDDEDDSDSSQDDDSEDSDGRRKHKKKPHSSGSSRHKSKSKREGKKTKKTKNEKPKGRLPRECSGMGTKIFPPLKNDNAD